MMKLRDDKPRFAEAGKVVLGLMVVTWSRIKASGASSHWRLDLG